MLNKNPSVGIGPCWIIIQGSFGERGWRSGGNTRFSPMKLQARVRFPDPASHMWVEFVVGSLPCSKGFFSGSSGFSSSSKTNISKFQFYLESEGHRFVS